jgi:hypothetical protein
VELVDDVQRELEVVMADRIDRKLEVTDRNVTFRLAAQGIEQALGERPTGRWERHMPSAAEGSDGRQDDLLDG